MKRILGYADRFSVRSGELIEFMVSSPLKDDLDVSFVRIVHGDLNPACIQALVWLCATVPRCPVWAASIYKP